MNPYLVILIGSTLGAMILWALHIDRRRSNRERNKEAESVASAYRRWASQDQAMKEPQKEP